MTNHPDWDALNALADGIATHDDVREHVAHCSACRETITALTQLAHDARALPSTLHVSDAEALWRDIESAVAPPRQGQHTRRAPWRALATAAGIAILSSGTTWWIMRAPTPVTATAEAVMPASFQHTEASYLDNVAQLRRDLDQLRDQLDPRTVAAVERSLAVIDAAIVEVRDALLADPANAAVSELLASHYRQKIELLRRATQLTPAA